MFNAICRRHCLHLAPAKRRPSAQVRFLSYSAICRDASRQPFLPPHKHSRTLPAYIQRQQQLVALQSRPELSVEEFEDFARRGEGSIEKAEACLYQLKTQLLQLPLQERHEKCLQHNAGKRILLWYWKRRASHEPTPNRTLAHLVTWFLVPEKRDDFVFRWIGREIEMIQSKDPKGLDDGAAMATLGRWAHFWLSGLATNHADWSPDRSPVETLQCFQRAFQEFGQYAAPKRPFVLVGLAVATHQAIEDETYPPYDHTLWDSYCQNLPRIISDEGILRDKLSTARLYHPSRADGLAFHDTLQWLGRNGEPSVWSARGAAKNAYTIKALRASYILGLQGHSDEAQWLRDQAELHNEPFFSGQSKRISRACDLDPKLEPLRHKASVLRLSNLK